MCNIRNSFVSFTCTLKVLFILNVIGIHNGSCVMSVENEASKSPELTHFNYCLRQTQQPSLSSCIGRTAISFLQRFDERENFTLAADFVATKDDKIASRSLVNILDTDPVDFRGILENAGAVISQRNLEWHMDALYPGLMFKIGPTADANSVAEFIIDPAMDERNLGGYEEPSTARLLAKQYFLPFLLGLKFNLVALVPLLFAGIVLLLKKSLFLAKLAIFVSGILGVGGAVSSLGGGLAGLAGGLGGLGGGFGGGLGGLLRPQILHGQPHALDAGVSGGYFPGKTSVFNNYNEADEFHHNTPYKRNDRTDRKVNFDKPREYVARTANTDAAAAGTTMVTPADRFYEYEKQVMLQDRSGKLRVSNGKLGPSAAFEEDLNAAGGDITHNFKTSDRLGWKVVDLRT